jgi:tRNA threonylcarbamoyladenosine biosynthesis protein TsaB
MKILALDSSGLVASVAIIENDLLVAEYTVNYKKTHSQTLLPMLDEISKQIELDLETIDRIAIAKGPGSFTGLRIGSATAKGLGFALQIKIIGVPTLHALAYNLYGNEKLICPIMDARRAQVYSGLFSFKEKEEQGIRSYELEILIDQCVLPIEEMSAKLNAIGREVIFLGDGVPVYAETLKEKMTVPYSFAPAGFNRQRAATIGVLAMKGYEAEEAAFHKPEYLRLSQAERERIEQGESN